MAKEEESEFELSFGGLRGEYFMHSGSKGIVFGPKIPGRDDHLTYGSDGDSWQIHRRTNGDEQWRLTKEAAQAELDSLMMNNVKSIEISDLAGAGVYVISLNRMELLFKVPELLAGLFMPLFFGLVGTKKESKSKNERKFELRIDGGKVGHLAAMAQGPLGILSRIVKHVPPRVPPAIITRVGRWVRVRPNSPKDFAGGVFLLFQRNMLAWFGRIARVDSISYPRSRCFGTTKASRETCRSGNCQNWAMTYHRASKSQVVRPQIKTHSVPARQYEHPTESRYQRSCFLQ